MAEPASSIITIVTVSLAVVKETYKYIKEICLVNDFIQALLNKLKDLHRLIRVVESTYQRAELGENSVSAHFVGRTLRTCQERLTPIKALVFELAARESETWLQKAALKRRTDGVKKQIEEAIQDMNCDMEYIRTGISCWSLDLATLHHRTRASEVWAVQHGRSTSLDAEQHYHPRPHPLEKSLSIADTLSDPDATTGYDLTTTLSRPSVSSASSRALESQSEDGASVMSGPNSVSSDTKCDWKIFHFAMTRDPISSIRTLLEQQQAYATMTNDWKRTPLHIAAQRGDIELARLLLEFGANINATDSRSTVLDLAIDNNQCDFVAFLLDQGVDETALLEGNKKKFGEMQSIIRLKKASEDNTPKKSKKDSRKLSWVARRGLSV